FPSMTISTTVGFSVTRKITATPACSGSNRADTSANQPRSLMARTSARNFSSLRSSPAFVCVTTARICSLAIITLPEDSDLLPIGGGGEAGGGEGCWGAAGDGCGAGGG